MKRLFILLFLFPSIAYGAGLTLPQGGLGTTTVPANWVLLGSTSVRVTAIATSSLYTGTNGQVLARTGGTWTGVATTTFSTGLTYASGAVTCDTASGSVFGCLSSSDWTTFNSKLGSYDAFSHTTNYGSQAFSATSTGVWFQGSPISLAASTTAVFSNATTTLFTNTGSTWLPTMTSAMLLTDSAGLIAEYAGASCTNQFPQSVSALGAWTCDSVVLTTDVSGDLPFANLAQVSANSVLANNTSATADARSVATSTLFGATGTGGFVLMFNGSTWAPAATATCVAITGAAGLCDGDDATGAGGGDPFSHTTNFGLTVSATTSPLWIQATKPAVSLLASSTAVFDNATTSLLSVLDPTGNTTVKTFANFIGNRMQFGPVKYPADYTGSCPTCFYLSLDRSTDVDDVSVLFRSQGNARGEIGLIGDAGANNLAFKTVTGSYGTESFSTRMVITPTGNVGIPNITPTTLFSVGTANNFTVDYSGNASTTGTIDINGTFDSGTNNGVLTIQGHQANNQGAYLRVRDEVLGTIGYFGQNSVINGGVGYSQLTIQNPQSTGTICLSAGGRASSVAGASCDLLLASTTARVAIASTTPWGLLSVHANNGTTNRALFAVGSSTASATTTLFQVTNTGIASTTNLVVSALGGASGCLSPGVDGTIGTSACSGGSGTDPFSHPSIFGTIGSATSTRTQFTGGLYASSTVIFGDAGKNPLQFDSSTARLGLGTSTPWGQISIAVLPSASSPAFVISTSTASATSTAFVVNQNGVVGIGTSTPSPTAANSLSAAGGIQSWGVSSHFGTTTCGTGGVLNGSQSGLQIPGIDYCGQDNSDANGVQIIVDNGSTGANAWGGFTVNNNLADNTLTHFLGLYLNSSNYTSTFFGNAIGLKNLGVLQNSDGVLALISSSSTEALAPQGIRFYTGGTNLTNERGRISMAGLWGVSSSTPWAKFSLHALNGDTNKTLFAIGSSTAAATTTLLSVSNIGLITGYSPNFGVSSVISTTRSWAFTFATTTTWTASTTNSAYTQFIVSPFAGTLRTAVCQATSTTSFLGITLSINNTKVTPTYWVASSTKGTITFTANNTIAAGDTIAMDAGTTTTDSNAKRTVCTITATQTSAP